jgi:hypothetical protein
VKSGRRFIQFAVFFACLFIFAGTAGAHCDTMDGPVVGAARTALESGDVTPVLKWVRKDDEAEIVRHFNNTLKVRKQGPEAKELADMYFFETLVRIHRAGEGAPYTGLKPAGAVEPAVLQADKALESGSSDRLVSLVTDAVKGGIHKRFQRAHETMKHADESVAQGREFVEAYVDLTHYVERLHMLAEAHEPLHGEEKMHGHE